MSIAAYCEVVRSLVERAHARKFFRPLLVRMQIHGGYLQAAVPEEGLDRAQVGAVLHQPGRAVVADAVRQDIRDASQIGCRNNVAQDGAQPFVSDSTRMVEVE